MDEPIERPGASSRGDPEAVEVLLQRHLPGLRAYVRLRMGADLRAKESASDLVQSTCREILENLDRYRHRGASNFRQWLFTTALRKVQNRLAYWRAGKREIGREAARPRDPRGDESLAALYQTLSTPSRRLMHQERVEALERAFDALSDAHREVILLARIVGLPHSEVALAMRRTEQATRSLLHRALAELAERLEE
jgi:RNA polymerase sigma-70 factor (subfamily 1)